MGAVLLQEDRPIAYESRQMTPAEEKIDVTEQELLACVHALKVWRCYFEGLAKFRLHTDHGADNFFQTKSSLSRRQVRWQEFLSRFHFEWKFIQGAKNMADPLSRRPVTNTPTGVCRQQLSLLVVTRGQARLLDASSAPPAVPVVTSNQGTTATAGPTAQQGNGGDRPSSAEPLSTDKPDCSPPDNALPTMHAWKDRLVAAYATDPWFCDVNTSSLFLDEGLWYNADGRMVIPDVDGIRRQLLSDFHDSPYVGHIGINKTMRFISTITITITLLLLLLVAGHGR